MCESQQPLSQSETALIQHKREAFDGMRAYHTSEINHKQHAIDVLKSVLTAVLTLYGGIIAFAVAKNLYPGSFLCAIEWGIPIVALVICGIFAYVTQEKFERDNATYELHRTEYIAAMHSLGLHQRLPDTQWVARSNGNQGGQPYTSQIVWWLAALTVFIATIGSVSIYLLTKSQAQDSTLQQKAVP